MASANDVTVVIPVSEAHLYTAERAVKSVEGTGAKTQLCIDNRHHGVVWARNHAIEHAETPLILPIDADDYLLPGAVERMAQAWQPNRVVYGGWRELTLDKEGEYIELSVPYVAPYFHYNDVKETKQAPPPEMLPRKHVCHATCLFAKEDWQRVGGYDPIFNLGSEDHEFMIALVEAGCELVRLEGEPLYVKTMGGERTQKAIQRQHLIRQLLIEKHPAFFRTP